MLSVRLIVMFIGSPDCKNLAGTQAAKLEA